MSKTNLIDILAEMFAPLPEHRVDHESVIATLRYADELVTAIVPKAVSIGASFMGNGFAEGGFVGKRPSSGIAGVLLQPGESVVNQSRRHPGENR